MLCFTIHYLVPFKSRAKSTERRWLRSCRILPHLRMQLCSYHQKDLPPLQDLETLLAYPTPQACPSTPPSSSPHSLPFSFVQSRGGPVDPSSQPNSADRPVFASLPNSIADVRRNGSQVRGKLSWDSREPLLG